MPFVRVQLAGGEGLEGGAGRDGDVGDHQAGMVGWHVVVESIRQNPVVSIEEDDDDSGEERYGAQLGERANLEVEKRLVSDQESGVAAQGGGQRTMRRVILKGARKGM